MHDYDFAQVCLVAAAAVAVGAHPGFIHGGYGGGDGGHGGGGGGHGHHVDYYVSTITSTILPSWISTDNYSRFLSVKYYRTITHLTDHFVYIITR